MNGGKKPANTGSGSPVLQGGEDVTPEKLKVARAMYDSKEHTIATIAQTVGVSRSALYRAFAEEDAEKAAERERERQEGEVAVSSYVEKATAGA